MNCSNCGAQLDQTLSYCPNCGENNPNYRQPAKVEVAQPSNPSTNQVIYVVPQQNATPTQDDSISAGLVILSILIPLAGFILYFSLMPTRPRTAKTAGLISLITFIVVLIINLSLY